MILQLEQDLVHFEGRRQRLDEDGGAHRAARYPERALRVHEHVVPPARFEVALQLGQVEIRPRAAEQQLGGVVEGEQAEVEKARRHAFAVHQHVVLAQVQPARAHHEGGGLGRQLVVAAGARIDEAQAAAHRLVQARLPFEQILPGRRGGVFEVGHEDVGAGVERVDDGLRVRGPGDLDLAAVQRPWCGRHAPLRAPHFSRRGEEIKRLAAIDPQLTGLPLLEKFAQPRAKGADQFEQKFEGGRRQDEPRIEVVVGIFQLEHWLA